MNKARTANQEKLFYYKTLSRNERSRISVALLNGEIYYHVFADFSRVFIAREKEHIFLRFFPKHNRVDIVTFNAYFSGFSPTR